jgi:peroxiredoxin 2/4
MALVGKQAPDFTASAVINGKQIVDDFTLSSIQDKYIVLFFYPLDFTFVCPTELHAFQEKLEAFKEKNVELIGCSIDSKFSHLAWLNTPKTKGGIEGIEYTLVSDINKTIAAQYDVLVEGEGIAYRGLFIIDKKGVVRHQLINDLPLGRNVDEALRLVDAIEFHETHGEVCPANWTKGEKAMQADTEGLETYFQDIKVLEKA